MQFNLADLWERVADTVPDHEALVCGERRLTFAGCDERANRLAHVLQDRGIGAGDHVALYLYNGDRVPRGHARRVQARRGADQRQLPLRRGRAAVPPRRRRRARRRVPRRVRTEARRDRRASCPSCRRSSRSTTTSHAMRRGRAVGAIAYEAALAAASAGARLRAALGRRPLHPLHRRHHRHAQRRHVAPRRRLLRRDRWRGRRRRADRRRRRRSPSAACSPAPGACPRARSCTAPRTGWRSAPCSPAAPS